MLLLRSKKPNQQIYSWGAYFVWVLIIPILQYSLSGTGPQPRHKHPNPAAHLLISLKWPCPASSGSQPSPLQSTRPHPTTPFPRSAPGCGQSNGRHLSSGSGNPTKMVKRILDLEFIEMNKLLPEAWGVEAVQPCCQGFRRPSHRAPVADRVIIRAIGLWP